MITIADFYSARQWHSTGMYTDCIRPQGLEHHIGLYFPDRRSRPPNPGGMRGPYLAIRN